MPRLNIYDRRERALVSAADRALAAAATLRRLFGRRAQGTGVGPRRILLLRLERIGDLVMALPAIGDVLALAPEARIDLAVGSWNAPLARAIAGIHCVETLDARWLARGDEGLGLPALLAAARGWRHRRYDLAINFEPDIRSNLVLAASGAAWTAGFASGGGGPLLDLALDYDTRMHTADNARRLVAAAFGREAPRRAAPLLTIPEEAARKASAYLPAVTGPLIGVHASGGRAVKQWDPQRFGEVARRLVQERDATIVVTGTAADRPLVDAVKAAVPAANVVDASGDLDLLTLAALLQRLDLFVTGDTGPMHLAAVAGTPVVSVFGPSDPVRYGPRGPHDRVVRLDLPCSPCNRIRLPPDRCTGHTPDCLSLLPADSVTQAALAVLDTVRPRPLTIGNAGA